MSSEYLKIGTSPTDLISHAHGLLAKGETLQSNLSGALSDIASREGNDVLPDDDFGKPFKDNTYHKQVPAATGSLPLNEATKQGAKSVADVAIRYGTAITDSMVDYMTVEGENQADIGSIK